MEKSIERQLVMGAGQRYVKRVVVLSSDGFSASMGHIFPVGREV